MPTKRALPHSKANILTICCNQPPKSFGTEFLDYKMAVKTVDSFDERPLEPHRKFGSKHSEAIVSEDKDQF